MNTKRAEEILIERMNAVRSEHGADLIDPENIHEIDKSFIDTTVSIMEEYASPLKKRIEELEELLDGIKHGNLNTVKIITNALLYPSTNGK